jgi:translation initiation factor 2B subunit (eIF-2B alpha/beta/delta family)
VSWREQLVAIMNDKLSGAVGVTQATAQMLLAMATEESFNSLDELLLALKQTGREVLTAQSGMASPVSLFNRLFFAIGFETEPDAAVLILQEAIQTGLKEQESIRATLCRTATALVPVEVSLLTHSASSTVLRTVLYTQEIGRRPRVYCLESRPLYEGRQLAIELAAHNVEVTSIIDSAVYANLQNIELVLVGADSLTEEGVVSKIGTAGLAVCAQSLGVPVYALADTSKIWPASLGKQPIHERAPADVWANAPENIKVQNRFYDITPWHAISGVVTEQGLLTAAEIRAQSRARPVHRLLRGIIAEVRSTVL